ncbi:KOW domain-containing RNA-binding protein [Proteinivorax hydrogeniformans]|uniref:KOW domain-containing RNA-binding protein n=1 Tax=Proteinivorax hydrogeniformans TaxID=1826727 RepID=A0AAU8HU54_9FIRM
MTDIQIGQLVRSNKGRDLGKLYIAMAIEGDRVLLVDGNKRTTKKPKAKNIKHITPITKKKTGFILHGPIKDSAVVQFINQNKANL